MLQGQMANERIVNSCASKTRQCCWTQCQDKTTKMHFANIQMGNFIWGRVYGLGKIGRGKVYDSLQEYSPMTIRRRVSEELTNDLFRRGITLKSLLTSNC